MHSMEISHCVCEPLNKCFMCLQYVYVCTSKYLLFSLSPSVLDRLNPLLEPGGVLNIDERGIVSGEVISVTPHPNFRYAT